MDPQYFEQYQEACIDLHGLNRAEAISDLRHFLLWAKVQDFHYVRIITGKGSQSADNLPVVKNAVLAFLNEEDYVYEFASMFYGGEGALHVAMK